MKSLFRTLGPVAAAGLLALAAPNRATGDETNDVQIKVKAPLDATSCTGTPPTISVLSLNIDVATASVEAESENEGEGDDNTSGTCADLTPGAMVEVALLGDAVPLAATNVDQEGEDDDGSSIQAPVQAVAGNTITVLGLDVDASNATLEGEDDDSDEGGGQPIDLSQIVVGQVVEIRLDASQLPSLVATRVELKNFTNQAEIDLQDDNGQEVSDDADDVAVDVTQTVIVKQLRPGKAPKLVKKILHQQFQTRGSFLLSGLAKGNATVNVVRVKSGTQTAARVKVHVRPNTTRSVKMRLRKTHS
jgi:hypothetical protein